MTTSCTTISSSRAMRMRNSTTSIIKASRRRIQPPISARRVPPTPPFCGGFRSPPKGWRGRGGGEGAPGPLYVLPVFIPPYLRPASRLVRKMFPAYRQVILDKAQAHCRNGGYRGNASWSSATSTPQDIHDRYKVLNGAIYGLASHGRFLGAFKPGNRSRECEGALSRRRRSPIRAGHADGDDVGMDRRRRARPGPTRACFCSKRSLSGPWRRDEPTRARLDRLAVAAAGGPPRPTGAASSRVGQFPSRAISTAISARHMNALRLAQWGAHRPDLRDDAPVVLYTQITPPGGMRRSNVLLSEQHFGSGRAMRRSMLKCWREIRILFGAWAPMASIWRAAGARRIS